MNMTITLSNPAELKRQGKAFGACCSSIADSRASRLLTELAAGCEPIEAADSVAGIGLLVYSGATDSTSIAALLKNLAPRLADRALLLVNNADFTGVYDGLLEALTAVANYRLHEIHIDYTEGARAGQGIAALSFDRSRTGPQDESTIPASKNKALADRFSAAEPVLELAHSQELVQRALARWNPATESESSRAYQALQQEFPDGASPKSYWHEAYEQGFTDFFAWGHDQDFGFGNFRQGAMSTRHVEIVSESIQYGYLPESLEGLEALDVGCWTGGDVLALAGLGARVTAIEEHPVSGIAAKRLCELLNVPATVLRQSLYADNPDWRGKFDLVYISGVIYHVTDPVLALRICHSYLKPGGRIVVETKASKLDGAFCEYGGTLEKGWNWYSPTLETLGRWLVDAGFERDGVRLHMRPVGRLLAGATKAAPSRLPERAGFSRPGSWLESSV